LPDGTYPGMDPVIARALAKEKDDRYPTCTALVEAARSKVHGNAPTEIRVTPAAVVPDTEEMPVPREPRGRRPAWLIAAAIVTIAAATTLAIAFLGRDRGTVGAPPSSSPSLPATSETSLPIGSTHLLWNKENRSTFANASGQVEFTDAIAIPGPQVVAIGHADDLDEDAVVWTKVGDRWQRHYVAGHNRPGDQKLEDIAWVDGHRLVVVGYDNGSPVSWYSDDDGASWTAGTGLTGGTDAKTVVQGSDGTIWALGPQAAWTSDDGATWTPADASAFADGFAWDAVVHGNDIVAVGSAGLTGSRDAATWIFHDGTWTRTAQATFAMAGDQYLRHVSVDSETDGLVAVGADDTDTNRGVALAWTSDDGSTWRQAAPIPGGANEGLNSVLFIRSTTGSTGRFMAGGWSGASELKSDAAIWYSRDGIHWIRERRATATYDLGGPGAQAIRALVPYGRSGIAMYAFGVNGTGDTGQPRLWRGTFAAS